MTEDDRKFIEEFKEEVSGCKAMNIGIGLYLKDGERLLSIIESLQATPRLETEDIQHLIARLEAIADLLRRNEKHMAMAKILADISALKGVIESVEVKEGYVMMPREPTTELWDAFGTNLGWHTFRLQYCAMIQAVVKTGRNLD